MSQDSTSPSELQLQQAIRVAIAATERGDYAGAMKVFKAIYGNKAIKAPPDGLSAFGLCVALEEKQTKKGIDLCRAAIAAQFYDARHYCNLINLHLKRADRKGAVEVLEEALERLPKDSMLLSLREKMGIHDPSPIGFLPRNNFLNRALSKQKNGEGSVSHSGSGFRFGNVHPMVTGLFVLTFFALIFGSTFFVLYRQAYG